MAEQGDLFTRGVAEAPAWAVVPAPTPDLELHERFAAYGSAALDEGEVLQMILAPRLLRGTSAGLAADALMARFGGLGRILGASQADLARAAGPQAAAEIVLLHALLARALQEPLRQRDVLNSLPAVKSYVRARLAAAPREAFHVLFLDKKNQLIADERMGEGTVDHAPVYPREAVRRALELSASAVLLVHNHPSGDASPSQADIEMTKQVVAAARALGIAVHDHFVVAGDQVASLRALGLM